MRSGSPCAAECTYIVDFASVVGICLCVCDTAEAGEELLRKRVERVAGHYLHDLTLTRGRMEAEEIFHGGKVGGLHILSENPLPYSGFVRNRKFFLGGILLHPSVVPAEIPRQYRPF
jgi:hypothetical protein